MATVDKNNIYINNCSNCEAVYFDESKRPLKSRSDKHKSSFKNCDSENSEVAKHCWKVDHKFNWNEKKVLDGQNRFIPRKIKETMHFLKNPNQPSNISHILPNVWLPNLQ